MLFQVMSIEFDWTQDDDDWNVLVDEYKQEVIDSTLGEVFEAESGDELPDVIKEQTGWKLKKLDYRRVYS
jgi:hypothetical protein